MAKFNTADRAAITREEFVERLRAWAPGKLKVMAAQAGLPPLAALAAMYAGFRALGVAGMILLPMALLFVKQLHDEGYVGLWK